MTRPPNHSADAACLLIESGTGVTELIVGVVHTDAGPFVQPLSAERLSGNPTVVEWSVVENTLALEKWALHHHSVFREGRVVK